MYDASSCQGFPPSSCRTLRFLAWLVSAAFPNYAYEWLLPEFERTMCEELDFRHEASNAREFGNSLRFLGCAPPYS